MKVFPPGKHYDHVHWVNPLSLDTVRRAQNDHKQFSYIPLPSIGHEHADAMIRRVMITAPFGCEAELRHLAAS